jgi:predicted regulator of Ras-like GTPase activity (Roadblock/LC7/MglB family)
VFETILRDLLATTPGAIGAIVLDKEGESVQFWAERVFDIGPDGLRAIGAYQGIYLAELRRICDRIGMGSPHRFTTEFARTKVLSWDLKDGYYVVVVIDGDANEGVAWHHLRSARQRLLAEL